MAEHTPTPWARSDFSVLAIRTADQMRRIGFVETDSTTPEAIANAAFIVKACNSHDALVRSLQRIRIVLAGAEKDALGRTWRRNGEERSSSYVSERDILIEDIDAALASAQSVERE